MAKRELPPAAHLVAQAVEAHYPDGDTVVGCSGGADSLALALASAWVARRRGSQVTALVVDHGLQPGSAAVAERTVAGLLSNGIAARSVTVVVEESGLGLEAAARDARLQALTKPGLPVLLGHTLDDQAESVLLGLLRGSGTRSLSGMAAIRGPFHRPLLGLRRSDTEAACRAWGVEWWDDPMNADPRFARVRARRVLAAVSEGLGRDVGPALARSAALARDDADALDAIAAAVPMEARVDCAALGALPDAVRRRVLLGWLAPRVGQVDHSHVSAVDRLVTQWHGQGPIAVPGGLVSRVAGVLRFEEGAARPDPR